MNALRTAARTATRPLGRRTLIDGLNAKPSNLTKTQRTFNDPTKAHLHGAENPTYLKANGDNGVFWIGGALCLLTWGQISLGLTHMKYGTDKID